MRSTLIFLISVVIGFFIGYLIAKLKKPKSTEYGGYLHVITQNDEESPYIFLEIENEEVLEGKTTITLQIKRSQKQHNL